MKCGGIIKKLVFQLFMHKIAYLLFDILVSTGSYVAIIAIGAICSHEGFIAAETKNVISRILFCIMLSATATDPLVFMTAAAALLA